MEPTYPKSPAKPLATVVTSVQQKSDLSTTLTNLNLAEAKPTLVIIGGASHLSDSDYQRIKSLFFTTIAPLAEELDLYVVDGGTDAGVMQLIGQARTALKATFPLIGVTPVDLLSLPDRPSQEADAALLEPNHTHCIAVPGNQWGDESSWMSAIATRLAQHKPSIFMLINGGAIALKDAAANIDANRSGIVIQGSGRTADMVAGAIAGQSVDNETAAAIANSGLMQVVTLEEAAEALPRTLKALLQ